MTNGAPKGHGESKPQVPKGQEKPKDTKQSSK